jgi:predicted solute-binding protein
VFGLHALMEKISMGNGLFPKFKSKDGIQKSKMLDFKIGGKESTKQLIFKLLLISRTFKVSNFHVTMCVCF